MTKSSNAHVTISLGIIPVRFEGSPAEIDRYLARGTSQMYSIERKELSVPTTSEQQQPR
jgi:hypothetical protein